ncbi:MAG: hypothetical protein AB8G99_09660 [Planctomycetaceae bacterium]
MKGRITRVCKDLDSKACDSGTVDLFVYESKPSLFDPIAGTIAIYSAFHS